MSTILLVILITISLFFIIYIAFYIFLSRRVKNVERSLIDIFHKKTSKIPALIEVMRPYIHKKEAFSSITQLHTDIMIGESRSLYDILGQNARLHNEFLFLMELSLHVRTLQKHEYFLYIRDFIISYERNMRSLFGEMNKQISLWNRFIRIKNLTIIGFFLPGRSMDEISS